MNIPRRASKLGHAAASGAYQEGEGTFQEARREIPRDLAWGRLCEAV